MNYKNVKLKDKHSLFLSLLILTFILFNIFLLISINNKIRESQNIGLGRYATISGDAEISVEPDSAFINFIIANSSQDIGEAVSQNEERMRNIVGIITILGVEKEDIRTVSFSVLPVGNGNTYEAKRFFEVKVKDINKIKSIIQGAFANEVDDIDSLRFSVDNQEVLKEQVRKRALDNIELQASKISEQLGISLGKIINFDESFVMPQFHIKNSKEIYEKDFQNYLDSGKIKISVDVTYEIK